LAYFSTHKMEAVYSSKILGCLQAIWHKN
jgi:hypothetical protein